jgi:tryptophan-rich sensory protein
MKINKQFFIRLLGSVALCLGTGAIGGIVTAPAISEWYQYLNKPAFSPPNWIFAPAWTVLYLLMAISLFLIWKNGFSDKKRRTALVLFLVQLFLNALWSILFFGLRSPLAAMIDIILMWFAIAAVLFYFYRLNKTAGLLFIPYLLWVSFAAVLNFYILKLN